jgi:arylsulfatase A-like enzyme
MTNFDINTKKPNIIIIVADDLGYGDVSMNGSKNLHTPNIDRLASEGIKFTDFHSNGTVCSPTRAALLTGRYQQRTGINGVITAAHDRHTGLDPNKFTAFPRLLKTVGYKTAIYGKWHVGYQVEFSPLKHGFDEFRGFVSGNVDYVSHIDQEGYDDWWQGNVLENEEGYTTDLITQHGIRFIEENKDEPFLLYLAHECPHYPYQARGDCAGRKSGIKPVGDLRLGSRQDRADAYKEMMEAMDEGIGMVIDAVKRQGIEKDTLVLFFSDNGPCGPGSSGGLKGRKGSLHEGGHRIPAAAWWPGTIHPGQVIDTPCIGMDLYPTIASLANVELPNGEAIDGVDLSSLLWGDGKLEPRLLFWGKGDLSEEATIRNENWKLIDKNGKIELYNLEDDLPEKNDLGAERPDISKTMLEQLNEWRKEIHNLKEL